MSRVPVFVVAALSLVAGFAVAQGTGVRALGGVVLLAGGAWCAWRAWRPAGRGRVIAALAIGLVCFAGAHALGLVIGAWPAVAVSALVLGAAAWALVDRRVAAA
jgi:hypothetical protein